MSEKIYSLVVPPHLEDLKFAAVKMQDGISSFQEGEYAEIGFLLLEVANGNKDALKKVSDFIRLEHRRLKDHSEGSQTFIDNVERWLINNRNWVVMSPKRIEIEGEN